MNLIPVYYNNYPHDLLNLHKGTKKGNFQIKKLKIPKGTTQQFYNQENGMCRCVFMTDYNSIQLRESKESIWMSDTPMEYETNYPAINIAKGDVLECGLGIGLFTYHASKRKQVKNITIVELEKDVIDLVYPVVENKKTNIINSDALNFLKSTNRKFDTIHIDLWGDILPYKEIEPVMKIAKRKLKSNGIVVCWLEDVWRKIRKNIKSGARNTSGFSLDMSPCPTCGKTLRHDYGGFCMDCADGLGISEIFLKRPTTNIARKAKV